MFIWTKIFGGELIWLKDHDNEVSLSIAKRDPWGVLTAERCWPFNIRTVILLPDGTVSGSCYVNFWKPVYGQDKPL